MSLKLPTAALLLAVSGTVAVIPGLAAMAGSRLAAPAPKLLANQPAAAPGTSVLNVEIAGLRDARGNVCLSLYNSLKPQLFPQEAQQAQESRCVRVTANPMVISFRNLKPGNYAIALLHDANGNGKDDRNFLGMPTEGFGFSRNPVVKLKAPGFDEASVPVSGATTTIKINVTYLSPGR
jgi:uncharacterized protein (DUF2141 family)